MMLVTADGVIWPRADATDGSDAFDRELSQECCPIFHRRQPHETWEVGRASVPALRGLPDSHIVIWPFPDANITAEGAEEREGRGAQREYH